MKLAFSTNAYLRYPFDEAADRIRRSATRGSNCWPTSPMPGLLGCWTARRRRSVKAMERHGLEFSNINAFMMNAVNDHRQPYWYPSFIEPDEDYRRVRIDHTRRALSLCAELGAPHITTEPGGPLDAGAVASGGGRPVRRGPQAAGRACPQRGVMLLIEPEPGLLLETTDQYLEVAERVNAPSIGLNFDVGHAYCVSEDIPRADRQTGAAHPALSPGGHRGHAGASSPGPRRRARSTSPRSSTAIRKTGYDGWLTVELYPFWTIRTPRPGRRWRCSRPLISNAARRLS